MQYAHRNTNLREDDYPAYVQLTTFDQAATFGGAGMDIFTTLAPLLPDIIGAVKPTGGEWAAEPHGVDPAILAMQQQNQAAEARMAQQQQMMLYGLLGVGGLLAIGMTGALVYVLVQ